MILFMIPVLGLIVYLFIKHQNDYVFFIIVGCNITKTNTAITNGADTRFPPNQFFWH